jgi:hypothetical protein
VLIVVCADEVTDIDSVSLFVARCVVPGEHVHYDELAVSLRRRNIDAVPDCSIGPCLVGVGGDQGGNQQWALLRIPNESPDVAVLAVL